MVYEARKQSMTWMETDYSKYTHFQWKISMAAGAFGRAKNYGWDSPNHHNQQKYSQTPIVSVPRRLASHKPPGAVSESPGPTKTSERFHWRTRNSTGGGAYGSTKLRRLLDTTSKDRRNKGTERGGRCEIKRATFFHCIGLGLRNPICPAFGHQIHGWPSVFLQEKRLFCQSRFKLKRASKPTRGFRDLKIPRFLHTGTGRMPYFSIIFHVLFSYLVITSHHATQ